MVRWIVALAFALQASTAFAQDKCGGGRIKSANAEILVIAEQQETSQEPAITHVGLTAQSTDGTASLSAGYTLQPDGRILPHVLFFYAAVAAPPSEDMRAQTIKWRRNDGAWKTYPGTIYAIRQGRLEFKLGQWVSGSRGLTYRAEELDELRQGGRYVVTRLAESGEEIAIGPVDYPDQATVEAMFAEARTKAIADLAPCGPPLVIRPAP